MKKEFEFKGEIVRMEITTTIYTDKRKTL